MIKAIANYALLPGLILISTLSFSQCHDGTANIPAAEDQDVSAELSGLTKQESASLFEDILFMREEEKLARDVYLHLYDIYPLRPFYNIAASEQKHMDAMLYLIDLYQLEDPVGDLDNGAFRDQELQELYNSLIERGSVSAEEALMVGALIEEIDILDLESALEKSVDHAELTRVYTNLLAASGNHLRAFVRKLGMYGIDYKPVELTLEAFDEIIGR